jgi:hypothetical protein
VAVVQFVAAELISLSKYFEVLTGAFDAWNIRTRPWPSNV